jgi:hypothetical protein
VVTIRLHAELVEGSVPVLVRGSILGRVDGVERSISAVGFRVVVRLMSGLVFLGWCVEMFTFLEEWPRLLVRISDINFIKQF